MKTHETKAASQVQRVAAPGEPKKKGAFAKILEQKSEEKPQQTGGEYAPSPLMQRTETAEQPATVKSAGMVRELDGIAHEISVVLRGADVREVQIQMDSKTLAGLQIRITKENGRLNVRLQSASAEISRMLSEQTDGLAQRLEARGYRGAVVQVQNSAPASFRETPESGRRDQGSRGGDAEQRRGRQK